MLKFQKCAKPKSLAGVNQQFYKLDGCKGYFLADAPNNDGSVPYLFFDGKWREDRYFINHN